MLFIDNERITVQQIKNYEGDDEVILKLQDAYNDLEENFFSKNHPVRYKLGERYVVKHEKGLKEYKGSIWIPYAEVVKTQMGTATVIYSENHFVKNGNPVFVPRGDWFDKQKVFNRNNIELAIFYYTISSVVNKGNKIMLDDVEQKATELAEERKKSSVVEFYLYNEDSVLFDDKEKLIDIAYICGVSNPSGLSVNMLKNAIYTAVNKKEGEINFVKAVKQITPFYQSLIDIQKGIDKQVLKYDKNKWWFVGKGNRKNEICAVNIVDDHKSKEILSAKLLMQPDVYDSLREMIVDVKEKEKEEVIEKKKKANIKAIKSEQRKVDEVNEYKDTNFYSFNYAELVTACKVAKISPFGKKKALLIKKLEEWRKEFV